MGCGVVMWWPEWSRYRNIFVLGYGHAYPLLESFWGIPFASDAKPNPDKMIGLEVMKHSVAFGEIS
jgi:hypothetical protein